MKYRIPKPVYTGPTYYKVYYDNANGQILSITIKEKANLKNYFSTTFQEVEEFIAGTKNLIDYKVVYDVKTANYLIIHRNDKIVLDIDNLVHKIANGSNAQLVITKDNKSKQWLLEIDVALTQQNNLEQTEILDETLWFSITEKNNPNILYKHFVVGLKDLLDNGKLAINFSNQEEFELKDYSVYTNKRLVSYAKKEIYV